jgi:hypothetical protein
MIVLDRVRGSVKDKLFFEVGSFSAEKDSIVEFRFLDIFHPDRAHLRL